MLGVSFEIWATREMLDEACDLTWWPMLPAEDNLRCESKKIGSCEIGWVSRNLILVGVTCGSQHPTLQNEASDYRVTNPISRSKRPSAPCLLELCLRFPFERRTSQISQIVNNPITKMQNLTNHKTNSKPKVLRPNPGTNGKKQTPKKPLNILTYTRNKYQAKPKQTPIQSQPHGNETPNST